MGAELSHVGGWMDGRTDGWTDKQTGRHDEVNSCFLQFYEHA